MKPDSALLLLFSVIAVGVLHTLVPDHWVPIAVLGRQRRWSKLQTGRAAAIAGLGHTLSTLAIGIVVWLGGTALAMRFGNLVSTLAGLALVGFGVWIAVASLREIGTGPRDTGRQRHGTALLLIVGSSPMIEGIPAFFAAARFGVGLLALMSVCFGISTIVTYVVLCVTSRAALESLSFGPLERYGEVISGAVIAVVGIVFLFWSRA